MGVKYENIPRAPESQRFFINRLRRYLLDPKSDWSLEKDIREGKYIGLEWILPDEEYREDDL